MACSCKKRKSSIGMRKKIKLDISQVLSTKVAAAGGAAVGSMATQRIIGMVNKGKTDDQRVDNNIIRAGVGLATIIGASMAPKNVKPYVDAAVNGYIGALTVFYVHEQNPALFHEQPSNEENTTTNGVSGPYGMYDGEYADNPNLSGFIDQEGSVSSVAGHAGDEGNNHVG